MKIKEFYDTITTSKKGVLKIIKKGNFWILLEDDAFVLSQKYSFKITKFDKTTIKVGFPNLVKQKWIEKMKEDGFSFVFYAKEGDDFIEKEKFIAKKNIYPKFDLEDFALTKDRILGLSELNIIPVKEGDFLLKRKAEQLYGLFMQRVLKMPRKERYFFREKIENIFLDFLENIYLYMYNLGNRGEIAEKMFSQIMLLREFTRFLYDIGRINNDNVYLDIGDRWVELLKIVKTLRDKGK